MSIFSSATWNRWRMKVEGDDPAAAPSPSSTGAPADMGVRNSGADSEEGSKPRGVAASSAASAPSPSVASRRRRSTTHEQRAESAEDMREEFDRRIRVLSSCLETKAEENITLNEQLERANRRIADMEMTMKELGSVQCRLSETQELLKKREEQAEQLAEALTAAELDKLQAQDTIEEYDRKIQVLSTCLEEMASENVILRSSGSLTDSESQPRRESPARDDGTAPRFERPRPSELPRPMSIGLFDTPGASASASSSRSSDVSMLLKEVVNQDMEVAHKLREELEATKRSLAKAEKRIVQLNTKLMESVNKKMAAEESNDLYEKKLKSLEKEMMENLHQEGIRRQEAEYVVSKLRKKVAELQFLLDERDQDTSDEDEDYSD